MGSEVRPRPTVERLREVLSYDPATGAFVWIKRMGAIRSRLGQVAGSHDSTTNRRRIIVDGSRQWAYRIAWAISTGKWPTNEIDHINGNSMDDRLSNLREATRTQNARNRAPEQSLKGVTRTRDRSTKPWKAQISINGSNRHLGIFDTPEEAHRAYRIAATAAFGEFARFD